MLINSVVIVLREVLEAALILSVLLAATRLRGQSLRWAGVAVLAGLGGAWIYGAQMDSVSELFEGVGQELLNASLQFTAYVALVVCAFLAVRNAVGREYKLTGIRIAMIIAVTLLIAREGAEIFVFLSAFIGTEDFYKSTGAGAFIGAAIGFSIGALLYYLLVSQPVRRGMPLATWLVAFMGAGMCSQAVQLLFQADWLHKSRSIWDSSALIPEGSLIGQLLYAMMGYEATPSAAEVITYTGSLMIMALAIVIGYAVGQRRTDTLV